MEDSERHQEIRKGLCEKLEKEDRIRKHLSSHEDWGKVILSRKSDEKRVNLAEPDIVVESEDGRHLLIEIEISDNPKHLLGVASAINASRTMRIGKEPFVDLDGKSLLIVLDGEDKTRQKPRSGKTDQIEEIKEIVDSMSNLEFFDIVPDDQAMKSVQDWLNGISTRNESGRGRELMLGGIEDRFGYRFSDRDLLLRALLRAGNFNQERTLSSAGQRTKVIFHTPEEMVSIGDQEPLETIGDSVIHLAITEHYFSSGEGLPKNLHHWKESLSSNKPLNESIRGLHLEEYVLWSKNEEGNEVWKDPRFWRLADCFEAIIGAIYLDGGMESVRDALDNIDFFNKAKNRT